MIKVTAVTLEAAYKDAASKLECSVTELKIEVVQAPSKGFLGLFKKPAIIVAVREVNSEYSTGSSQGHELKRREASHNSESSKRTSKSEEPKQQVAQQEEKQETSKETIEIKKPKATSRKKPKNEPESQHELNDTIMPASFVSIQEDEDYEDDDVSSYLADYEDEEESLDISEVAQSVQKSVNELFDMTCFNIDSIEVSVYDDNTLLIEFKGEDAALLIGKEGYRYKALSYMLFNWINTKYQVQLRLEIAEFLKNQEESISKYLVGVCENIERDGRAQTKILDGVLIQIALNELRDRYPEKYIVIRSTRDGLKYIIINDYHNN